MSSSYPWFTTGSNIAYVGGNVGIGIVSPVNKLDVVGNISCSVITASLFYGTASLASYSLSSSVATVSTGPYYLLMATGSTVNQPLYIDNGVTLNAATNTLTVTSSNALYAITASGTTPGLNASNRITWTAGEMIFSSGVPYNLEVAQLLAGGSCLVKLTIQGDDVNTGTPYTYYGEFMVLRVYSGASPQPGYILRQISSPTWAITSTIIDPGAGTPNTLQIYNLSFTVNQTTTARYLMEKWLFVGSGYGI